MNETTTSRNMMRTVENNQPAITLTIFTSPRTQQGGVCHAWFSARRWSHTSGSCPFINHSGKGKEERKRFIPWVQPKTALGWSWVCPWPQGLKVLVKSGAFRICNMDNTSTRIFISPTSLNNWMAYPPQHHSKKKLNNFSWYTELDYFLYFCSCQWLVCTAPQWFKFQ